MRNQKFIISGGGTGGHIFPAISIADELKSRFSHPDILFVYFKSDPGPLTDLFSPTSK